MARLLVVDDDEDVRNLVARRVQQAGHLVVAAASAEEALEVVETRGAPDLAILDVSMPGQDGLALLDSLRAREMMADLPAIFLSARVQDHDIAKGHQRNAVYLTKPFVASALMATVEKLLAEASAAEPAGTW